MFSEYSSCQLCPRCCGVNRNSGQLGFCGAGTLPQVSKISLHPSEEPILTGKNGAGTVFFTHCTLGCVFCQNFEINSCNAKGREMQVDELAAAFIKLQKAGAQTVDLVTPTQYMPVIKAACLAAKQAGLTLPIVYNTGGFERAECIRALDGIVDIYLPDLKYFSPYYASRYAGSADYFDYASAAISEMVNQTGKPVYDADGMLRRGVLIRHLMLPGLAQDTHQLLRYIAGHWGDRVLVSLMRQYTPVKNNLPDRLGETVTDADYAAAVDDFTALGLEGFVQSGESVGIGEIPKWDM